jgi:hypothetical protein
MLLLLNYLLRIRNEEEEEEENYFILYLKKELWLFMME